MFTLQLTGLSGAGKSTIAHAVQERLHGMGIKAEIIDGDAYRRHLCRDLGFSKADRIENIQRLGFVAHVLARNGIIAIIAAINPYETARQTLKTLYPETKTVWIQCPLSVLRQRDTKGLYRRATLDTTHPDYLPNLSGVNDPYEAPEAPDLIIHTENTPVAQCVEQLLQFILQAIPTTSAAPATRP
jgi:adenylylsulfate kinase